jgi:hypothetical protein
VSYRESQLRAGKPVMLGVDYKAGNGRGATVNGIDHSIVATGMGTDEQGRRYITFNDPAQRSEAKGKDTNPENRLYLDEKTGRWSQQGIASPYSLAGVVENR